MVMTEKGPSKGEYRSLREGSYSRREGLKSGLK